MQNFNYNWRFLTTLWRSTASSSIAEKTIGKELRRCHIFLQGSVTDGTLHKICTVSPHQVGSVFSFEMVVFQSPLLYLCTGIGKTCLYNNLMSFP